MSNRIVIFDPVDYCPVCGKRKQYGICLDIDCNINEMDSEEEFNNYVIIAKLKFKELHIAKEVLHLSKSHFAFTRCPTCHKRLRIITPKNCFNCNQKLKNKHQFRNIT